MGLLDMTPDQADMMMGLGMGLLSAGGPSRVPVGFGQALAGGMQGFQQAQQYARQKKMQDDAVALQQDRFNLEKSYKDLQEQQMRASLAQAERAQATQDAFMKQFGALMTPQPQQQPSFDPSNFNMEQATPETYIKPAQMLLARKRAGGRLTPEQESFLSTVQSAIRQPPAAQQPDMDQVAALSAFGQLAGVKGASGLMEYAKFNKPDWQQVDNGGSIQFVNKNGGQMPVIGKTMSPDAMAANQLGYDRLGFDQQQANRPKLAHIEGNDGLYAYDERTGTARPVVNPQSGEVVPGGKGLTDSQGKATTYAMRARSAADIIDAVGKNGMVQPGLIKRTLEAVPLAGEGLGTMANGLQSSSQQQVEQAQRDFVNAVLRLESGAAISPQEFDNAKRQYFPQPGDSPAVVAQKKTNRETEIRGLSLMSGPGAKNVQAPQSVMSSGGWSATVIK